MHTQGLLKNAYRIFDLEPLNIVERIPVVMQVESDQARFANFLFQSNQVDMLLPQNSAFKVIEIFMIPEQNTYYMRIKQITQEEALLLEFERGQVLANGIRRTIDTQCE